MAAQAIFHMNADININDIINILNQHIYKTKPLKKTEENRFNNEIY